LYANEHSCVPRRPVVTADLYQMTAGLGPDELAELTPHTRPEVPAGCLLAELGLVLTHAGRGRSRVTMQVGSCHLNQRGIVQAGAMVALADAAAGWAAYTVLDDGAFTTLELRCSLLRAARTGQHLVAEAAPVHLGRRTLVFEVDICAAEDTSRRVARFGCTQLVLDTASAQDGNRDR
jgi:uncharacterized protein (TIGR00369 family)